MGERFGANLKKAMESLPEVVEKMTEWVEVPLPPAPPPSPLTTTTTTTTTTTQDSTTRKEEDVVEGSKGRQGIVVDYKILHLMANTASERTIVVRFRHESQIP